MIQREWVDCKLRERDDERTGTSGDLNTKANKDLAIRPELLKKIKNRQAR